MFGRMFHSAWKNGSRWLWGMLVLISMPLGFTELGAMEIMANGRFDVPVTTLRAQRFAQIVEQRYDFSCGAAALATLLRNGYGRDLQEDKVMMAMYLAGNQPLIRKEGFSLLDMKKYLKTMGYDANGYEAPLEKLKAVDIPAIVLLNIRGYRHFVVVMSVTEDQVVIADSSRGVANYAVDEFKSLWNGIIFVIENAQDLAKNKKNSQLAKIAIPRYPLGEATRLTPLAWRIGDLPGVSNF